jgi:cytochrome c-type biogenesis protein CcmE
MFQHAYNIALYNKCDMTVRAGGLVEEGIIQKTISHLILLLNNAVLQIQWIIIQCIPFNKSIS